MIWEILTQSESSIEWKSAAKYLSSSVVKVATLIRIAQLTGIVATLIRIATGKVLVCGKVLTKLVRHDEIRHGVDGIL